MLKPLPMLAGLRGPDATATRQALFALQKQIEGLNIPVLTTAAERPTLASEPGTIAVESDTGRMFVREGSTWRFVGPDSIFVRDQPSAPSGGHGAVGGWATSGVVDFTGRAQISFNAIIDVDTPGRAGYVFVEKSTNAGWSVSTVDSVRWHDASEGENVQVSGVFSDVFAAGYDTWYRLKFTVDGGLGSATIRGDSRVFVEWFGR